MNDQAADGSRGGRLSRRTALAALGRSGSEGAIRVRSGYAAWTLPAGCSRSTASRAAAMAATG